MQAPYKKHQKVILLVNPNLEYIEYSPEFDDAEKKPEIKKGMLGEINMILSNGKYHVRILDKKGKTLAYVPMDEEELGIAEE